MAYKPQAFTPSVSDILQFRNPLPMNADGQRRDESQGPSPSSGRQTAITSREDYILKQTLEMVSDPQAAASAYINGGRKPALEDWFKADAIAKSKRISEEEFFAQVERQKKDSQAELMQKLFPFAGTTFAAQKEPLLYPMEQPRPLTLEERLYGNEDFYINEAGVLQPRPKPEVENKLQPINSYQMAEDAMQRQRDVLVMNALADENFLNLADRGAEITEKKPPYAYTLLPLAAKAVYDYYIAREDLDSARSLLQAMRTETTRQEGRKIAEELDDIDNTLLRWLAKGGVHLGAGLTNGVQSVGRAGLALQPHRAAALDYALASPTSLEYASRTSLERSGEGGKLVGQLLYAAGGMAPGVALSAATGSPAGLAAYTFMSSLGNTYMAGIMEGKSDREAAVTGLLTGFVDAGLQYALGGVGTKAGSAASKGLKSQFSKMVAKVCDNPTVSGAVNAGGQWLIDAGAQGLTDYAQHIFAELIYKAASGDRSGVDLFSEDALQALFIGSLLGGIYNLGNIPKDYQMQAMGTVALQMEGVTEGLMRLAGQSQSLEVLQAAREANRTSDPMAYGRLMLAVQDELGLTYKGGAAVPYTERDKLVAQIIREDAPIRPFTEERHSGIIKESQHSEFYFDSMGQIKRGEYAKLIKELDESGKKFSSENIVAITRTKDDRLIWLETGNKDAGLEHVIQHAEQFAAQGIPQSQIANFIITAARDGKIIGYQGRGQGRPIYELDFNGKTYRVAITIGSNGFIVGANPRSINEVR